MQKKKPEDIVADIQEACKALGWAIAMDDTVESVSGLVIGKFEYVEEIVNQLETHEDYAIYQTELIDVNLQ